MKMQYDFKQQGIQLEEDRVEFDFCCKKKKCCKKYKKKGKHCGSCPKK